MKDLQALESPSPPGNILVFKTRNSVFPFLWFFVAFLDRDRNPLTLFNPDSQHCALCLRMPEENLARTNSIVVNSMLQMLPF